MSELLGSNFKKSITENLKECSRSIIIISPYVTVPAVKELVKALSSSVKTRCLITVPPGIEYVTGSVEVEALELLEQSGFEIRCLPALHAKIYLLDEKQAYVGSSNFTSNGWGLSAAHKENVEEMILIKITKNEQDHIFSRYIDSSNKLNLRGEWKSEVEECQQRYLLQYQQLMKSIIIKYPSEGFSKFSDYKNPPNGYKYHFKFSLAKTTGKKIKREKTDILLKLGGDKDKPHATINIPFSRIGKYLTTKYATDKRGDWQFGVYIDNEQNIELKIKDVVIDISNKDLKGVLSVEYKKVENNKIVEK